MRKIKLRNIGLLIIGCLGLVLTAVNIIDVTVSITFMALFVMVIASSTFELGRYSVNLRQKK